MKKYILVQWPNSQMFMEHERFNECLLVQDIDNHEQVGSSAYMVPEDLYEEVDNYLKYGDIGVAVDGTGFTSQYFIINNRSTKNYYVINGGIEIDYTNKISLTFNSGFTAFVTRKATEEEISEFKRILEFNNYMLIDNYIYKRI